jgi:glycyl-tRNA synthetase
MEDLLEKIVSLCKRRGFVFPGSEIYGGLANTYDFGPLGVLMLRNIIDKWWTHFVTQRNNMYGLDTSILMSPKVWEASGHTKSFTDVLIDCKKCKTRTRADLLIENHFEANNKKINVEGKPISELTELIQKNKIKCPNCGSFDWTDPRKFNLLFETNIGIVTDSQSLAYLRGEIAQGMFVNFKNVLDTMRPKLPFGIAQAGKAFRNEITLGNFIFRTLEFNLAEFEFFFDPKKDKWEDWFEYWKKEMESFATSIGLPLEKLKWREHSDAERAHYSTKTQDLDFEFATGFKEMFGLAYRTDFDLKNHMEKSEVDLRYTDPITNEKIIPHVVEPTFGINRIFLALLTQAYDEEKERTVLRLQNDLAPYTVAVFPLLKNKPELVKMARNIFDSLKLDFRTVFDDRGNIGKRYYAQDEIGTPWCVTIDFESLDKDTVTIRDRDSMKQERIPVNKLNSYFQQKLRDEK